MNLKQTVMRKNNMTLQVMMLNGGVLLAALSLDGNCGLFPIAVAIVELENGDSWGWFLHLLCSIISDFSRLLTVMSDGQKVS